VRRSLTLAFTLVLGLSGTVMILLFIGSLGQLHPGNPFVAVVMGVAFLLIGFGAVRAAVRPRVVEERSEPEDVEDLGVVFRCGDCGTELRVERLGELQVPRHCGEPMLVERRPATRH